MKKYDKKFPLIHLNNENEKMKIETNNKENGKMRLELKVICMGVCDIQIQWNFSHYHFLPSTSSNCFCITCLEGYTI